MTTRNLAVVLGIIVLLSACREAQEAIGIGPDPADPSLPVRERGYRSVTGDAHNYSIVAPRPWSKSNEEVAPKSK